MPIIRREKASRFFTLSRETAQDRTLSYEARGMLGYLLSHSDGWEAQLQIQVIAALLKRGVD